MCSFGKVAKDSSLLDDVTLLRCGDDSFSFVGLFLWFHQLYFAPIGNFLVSKGQHSNVLKRVFFIDAFMWVVQYCNLVLVKIDGLNVVSESWDELTDKFRPTEERTPPTSIISDT